MNLQHRRVINWSLCTRGRVRSRRRGRGYLAEFIDLDGDLDDEDDSELDWESMGGRTGDSAVQVEAAA